MWISQFLLSIDISAQWEKIDEFKFLEVYKKAKSINENSLIASLGSLNKRFMYDHCLPILLSLYV